VRVDDVADLLAQYRRITLEWANLPSAEHRKANRLFDQRHAIQKELAATQEGRESLASLMEDEDPDVRGSAAAHSLRWSEPRAREVLVAIRDHEPRLRASLSATYVLKEHDAGRLSFDY
jgi:Domain of unknown function (DUF2019)